MNRLAKRLDPRLDDITLFHELTEAESLEIEHLYGELSDLESNMTIGGTTADQIDRREDWFAVISDRNKTLEQRQAVLVAKLQGQGVTTPSVIMTIAGSFGLGDVIVDETRAPYTVYIIFQDVLGVPENMSDFVAAIEEVKPAHLKFEYIYKYNTWQDYVNFHHTLGEWRDEIGITWGKIRVYTEDADSGQNTLIASIMSDVQATIRKAVAKLNGISK